MPKPSTYKLTENLGFETQRTKQIDVGMQKSESLKKNLSYAPYQN